MNSGDILEKFKKTMTVFLGAFVCCFLWGSAFPMIKIGYKVWKIESSQTWSVIRFAGIRFTLAGLLVILLAGIRSRKIMLPRRDECGKIMLLSLFQTIGQYIFFYLGLAHTTGVNSAVVDSLTAFFAIITASLVMKTESLTVRKLLGCLLGFSGVILINLTGAGFSFRPLGDGLVALSAMCYGFSSCLIKKYSAEHDTVLFSGYQFIFGGLAMTLAGQAGMLVTGEKSPSAADISISKAVLLLVYLALVSSVAYTLWGILLRKNEVSKISVFGFMTPVTGVILSALLLGEKDTLSIRHCIALVLISAGIAVVNTDKHEKVTQNN